MEEKQIDIDNGIGIGDKEPTTLEAKEVEILEVHVFEVGEKKNQIVKFTVKHPDKEETIKISQVKYEKNGALKITALWYNLDEDDKIQKGSALATFMAAGGASTLEEMIGKKPKTVVDDKGFLAFKAY